MALQDANYPKLYKNGKVPTDRDFDAWRTASQDQDTRNNLNFTQLAKDCFVVGYEFDNDGLKNKSVSLEQRLNDLASGATPITGTTSDSFTINTDGNSASLDTTGLTSSVTMTFPSSSGVFVIEDGTQTLSNKTFSDLTEFTLGLDVNGATNGVVLDTDGDSKIYASADNVVSINCNSNDILDVHATYVRVNNVTKTHYIDFLSDASENFIDGSSTVNIRPGGAANSILKIATTAVTVNSLADLIIGSTKKVYLDSGSNTYFHEVSADIIQLVAGGNGIFDVTSTKTLVYDATRTRYVETLCDSADGFITSGTGLNLRVDGSVSALTAVDIDVNARVTCNGVDVLGNDGYYAVKGSDDGGNLFGDLARRWGSSPGSIDYMGVLGYNGVTSSAYCGVFGYSAKDYGVYGYAANDYGVYGYAANDYAIVGAAVGDYGVQGSAVNFGVYGYATTSVGVDGYSLVDKGVRGIAGGSFGGHFTANGTNATGCYASGTGTGYDFFAGGGGGTAYGSFTGGHDVLIEDSIGPQDWEQGMLIKSTGECLVKKESTSCVVCYVNLSNSKNDNSVFGVFTGFFGKLEKSDKEVFWYYDDVNWETTTRSTSNSLGDGVILITNINGDVDNGDYITSSEISGYGCKQDDDILHSYTVAKCTESVDWDNVTETVEYDGMSYKKKLVACTYHCG